MKQEVHDYGMANGHAPQAAKVVCVDFDGVIVPWGPLFPEVDTVNHGTVEAIRWLKEQGGFTIVILTSRLSPKWLGQNGEDAVDHYNHIASVCKKFGIPFDDITAEKVPAIAYIDDRAVNYNSTDGWDKVMEGVACLE